jgi:hypothetical protein
MMLVLTHGALRQRRPGRFNLVDRGFEPVAEVEHRS